MGRTRRPTQGPRHRDPDREPRPRRRVTYTRPHGVRHLFAAYDLGKDKLYGHIKKTKNRPQFLEFCRYLRSFYPATGAFLALEIAQVTHLAIPSSTPEYGPGYGEDAVLVEAGSASRVRSAVGASVGAVGGGVLDHLAVQAD